MRRNTWLGTAAIAAATLALASCGSSSTTTAAPTTSTPAATSAPTTVATVSKAVIIQKGDAICGAMNAKVSDPKSESAADIVAYLQAGVTNGRDGVKQFEALGTPDADAAAYADVIAKETALLDTIEKKAAALEKDPSLLSSIPTDPDITTARAAYVTAAKGFGFVVCGKDSSGSSGGTTTVPDAGTASTPTEKAAAFLSGFTRGTTFTPTDAQVSCIATSLFSDPAMEAVALHASTASLADKKVLYSSMVDCLGPDLLIDAYMAGIAKGSNPPTPDQAVCIRADLAALPKSDGVDLVAGDPDATAAFQAKIDADCLR